MVAGVLAVSDLGRAGIGAVGGGLAAALITLAVNAFRERRRRRRADHAALQLVIFEIGNAERASLSILGGAHATAFPVKAWEEGRLRLAQFLPPDAWLLIAAVYDAIHGLNWRYKFDLDHGYLGSSFAPRALSGSELRKQCRQISEATGVALPALRELSHPGVPV